MEAVLHPPPLLVFQYSKEALGHVLSTLLKPRGEGGTCRATAFRRGTKMCRSQIRTCGRQCKAFTMTVRVAHLNEHQHLFIFVEEGDPTPKAAHVEDRPCAAETGAQKHNTLWDGDAAGAD